MTTIRATFREDDNTLKAITIDGDSSISADLESDYVIKGAGIYMNTTEGWNSNPMLIAKKDTIYVYTDYDEIDGELVPGIKVGDGKAYLIDIPFTMGNKTAWERHINDTSIHVTQEEKEFWNNKNRAEIVNDETLLFTIY